MTTAEQYPARYVDFTHVAALVCHGEGWTPETVAQLREQTTGTGLLIIGLGDGATLDALDEDEMRAAGWVRA